MNDGGQLPITKLLLEWSEGDRADLERMTPLSVDMVKREWSTAKASLYREITDEPL